jgi:hypothetical protein
MNIFELPLTRPTDFIVSSLVAHHLSDREITEFLRLMEKVAQRGWLIYDCGRSSSASNGSPPQSQIG